MNKISFLKCSKTIFLLWVIFLLVFCYLSSSRIAKRFLVSSEKDTKNFSFEDKHFERVLKAFKNKDSQFNKTVFRQGNIPSFYLYCSDGLQSKFWQIQLRHILKNECPFQCRVSDNISEVSKVDAIVLYLRHLKSRKFVKDLLPNRDYSQPWIMLTFECPKKANNYHANYTEFNFMFNRTMMYRKDADIIVNHGFVVSKSDAKFLPFHWRIPFENLSPISYESNKTVVVSTLSNCEKNSGRWAYIQELQKYINVDIYGYCGRQKCGHSLWVQHDYKPNTDKCLKKFGTSYMFYLAFENTFCTDYGTEKIYNLLYYPMVPIVYGGINYEEILPPNSYINIAHYSPKELASYINYLVSNPIEYKKYLKWRDYYTPSTIGGERILCDLCTRLHDPDFYKFNLYENFYKWFLLDSECERKWTIDNRYNLTYKPIQLQ